jgi:hypothetical protein
MEHPPTVDPVIAGDPVILGGLRDPAMWAAKVCAVCGQLMWEGPQHRKLIEEFERQGQSFTYLCIPCTLLSVAALDVLVSNAGRAADEIKAGITCPLCGKTSHNPRDVATGSCGNCHDWTGNGYHG